MALTKKQWLIGVHDPDWARENFYKKLEEYNQDVLACETAKNQVGGAKRRLELAAMWYGVHIKR